jgi:hypothetical protein
LALQIGARSGLDTATLRSPRRPPALAFDVDADADADASWIPLDEHDLASGVVVDAT